MIPKMPSMVLLFLYLNTLYLTCDASDASVSKLHLDFRDQLCRKQLIIAIFAIPIVLEALFSYSTLNYSNVTHGTKMDLIGNILLEKVAVIDTNSTSDEDVRETQYATCKIATEELVASARASVTRVLTGACNAKMIDEKFQTLENNLTKNLEEIKSLLYEILENKKLSPKFAKMYDDYRYDDKNDIVSSRQQEIDNFNNTIQRTSSLNGSTSFFFYYWQIKRFDGKLASWRTARSERSSTFYVGQNGYAMYIKVTPRYFPDGTVFIGVGLTRGLHDSTLKWPFPHKIRIEVLDHSPEQPRQDRRSRIWDPPTLCSEYFWGRPKLTGEPDNPECVGLSISRQVFFSKLPSSFDYPARSTRYLWNGSITIKLTVFL